MTKKHSISPLRQRMIEDMTLRKLSPKTQSGYIRAVKKFVHGMMTIEMVRFGLKQLLTIFELTQAFNQLQIPIDATNSLKTYFFSYRGWHQ